jgi:hypothetical protein
MLKKSKWRRRTMAAVAVLALAPIIPGILLAEAHSFTAPSTVSIKWSATGHKFHGMVDSGRLLCIEGRTVNLYRSTPGTNTLIGTATTGPAGGWVVPRTTAHGTFYSRVTRSSGGGYGHSHVCLTARSADLPV